MRVDGKYNADLMGRYNAAMVQLNEEYLRMIAGCFMQIYVDEERHTLTLPHLLILPHTLSLPHHLTLSHTLTLLHPLAVPHTLTVLHHLTVLHPLTVLHHLTVLT